MDLTRYKAILIAVGTVLGIIMVVTYGLSHFVHFKSGLSPQEQQLARYEYQKVEIRERKPAVFSGLTNPMAPAGRGTAGRGYPSESLAWLAPQGASEKDAPAEKPPGVSMVIIRDRYKMAIINGEVVKEGDRTKNGRVLRITKNGVLIKNTEGEQWLKIE